MSQMLSLLQKTTIRFMQSYGPCTDEDLYAGVLLQVHGLDYNGGGWEKAGGWISLMEALREYSVIGAGCDESAEYGQPGDHLPETCLFEENAAHDWIAGVSSGSVGGREAIELIAAMARAKWFAKYGDTADEVMDQRIEQWVDWTCELCPDS